MNFGIVVETDGTLRSVEFSEWSSHPQGVAGAVLGGEGMFVGACSEESLVLLARADHNRSADTADAEARRVEPNVFKFPECFEKESIIYGPIFVVKNAGTDKFFGDISPCDLKDLM